MCLDLNMKRSGDNIRLNELGNEVSFFCFSVKVTKNLQLKRSGSVSRVMF